jgi:imidazolonepropionase-like amidohydrolase
MWVMCLVICLLLPSSNWAQKIALEGKVIHTLSHSGPLKDGVVLIADGKITAVGPHADVSVPDGYQRLSAAVVTPGLIDVHSVVGLAGVYNVTADQDQDEATNPNQAALRAIDGFNPDEPLLAYLLQHGVTVIQTGPGLQNPIAGQAGIFKTAGKTLEAMTVRFPSSMLFNLGEVPKQTYAEKKEPPTTRMGTAALIRQALLAAQHYNTQQQDAATQEEEAKPPDRDLQKEALAQVVRGELPALFTAHRADDILTAIRIAKEFGLQLVLDAATEGYLITEAIQSAGVPVLVHPSMQRLGGPETLNTTLENAALLANKDILIAIQSGFEAYVPKTRVVLFEAAIALVNGLGFDRALQAITLNAAKILGIDDRVGSLEPGKDADAVLFNGDPFEYTSQVEAVVLNGQVAYRKDAK